MRIQSRLTMMMAGVAMMMAAATTGHADSMSAPDADDLARWAAAYAEIKAMEPKWGVQGAEAFKASSDAGVPVFYLDVRTDEEWAKGYVEGAVHVSLTTLATPDGIAKLPEDKSTIMAVYCKSGHRSALAIPALHALGYANAVSMKGGYEGWAEAGYPLEGVTE